MYNDFFGNTFRMCWSLRVIVVGVVIALLGLEASSQHYHETFEKGLKSPPWNEEGIKGSISTKQSVSGSKSWRAYLTAKKYRNARSEIRWTGGGTNTTNHHDNGSTWGVKLAIFFPSNFKPDK